MSNKKKSLTIPKANNLPVSLDPLKAYLREISRYELLSIEDERKLTDELKETGDIEIAKQLVVANLRLVVKIALQYRSAYQNTMDLIQEGNIGLMHAVSKYDSSKGAKLSYYASWWIKSYVLKFILDNFRLVKIGSSKEKKRLFYNLMKEKEKLESQGITPKPKLLSEKLGVSEKAVIEMDQRLSSSGGEVSFDANIARDGHKALGDILETNEEPIEEKVAKSQELQILEAHLKDFLEDLKPRDKEIFTKRLLSDIQPSLQSIANDYGVSKERIRQIEERLLAKLKVYMNEYLG